MELGGGPLKVVWQATLVSRWGSDQSSKQKGVVTGEGAFLPHLGESQKKSPGKLRFWGEILPVVSGQQIPKLRSFVGVRVYCAIPDINKTPPANPSKDSYWDVRLEVTNNRPIKTGHVYIQPTYLYVYIYMSCIYNKYIYNPFTSEAPSQQDIHLLLPNRGWLSEACCHKVALAWDENEAAKKSPTVGPTEQKPRKKPGVSNR